MTLLGAMDCNVPYEFIGFGVMDGQFPYEFIGFGTMDCNFPCEFIGFGANHDNLHYESIGLGTIIWQASTRIHVVGSCVNSFIMHSYGWWSCVDSVPMNL